MPTLLKFSCPKLKRKLLYLEQLFFLKGSVALVNGAVKELSQAVARGQSQSGEIIDGVDNHFIAPKPLETARLSEYDRDRPQCQFQFLGARL